MERGTSGRAASYPTLQMGGQPRVVYTASSVDALGPMERVMVLARPVAEYVLRVRAMSYPPKEIADAQRAFAFEARTPFTEIDILVGWLVRCLYDRGLIGLRGDASDPRRYYPGVFAGRDSFSGSDEINRLREKDMFFGFPFGLLPAFIAMDVPFR